MNWKQISEKSPRAFKHLYATLHRIEDDEVEMRRDEDVSLYEEFERDYLTAYEDSPWNWRNLYYFFDEIGLYVEIGIDKTMEAKFCYEISWEKDFDWKTTGYSDLEYTRERAEETAFERAFEILEERL